MMSTFQVDTRELSAALKQYKELSRKSLVEIIIRKTLFIIKAAMRRTPRADRTKMEADLKLVAVKLSRDRKTGKLKKRGNIYGAVRFFEGRVVKRWQAEGKSFTHAEVKKEAGKGIGRRLSAIGSLRSGWTKPFRKFLAAAGISLESEKLPRVKHPGDGTLPKEGTNPEAVIEYDLATSRQGSKVKDLDPRVVTALEGAMIEETESLKQQIAKALQANADKFNAK